MSIESLADRDYVELLTERCVERFMRKLFLSDVRLQTLVMISPFIGTFVKRDALKFLNKNYKPGIES